MPSLPEVVSLSCCAPGDGVKKVAMSRRQEDQLSANVQIQPSLPTEDNALRAIVEGVEAETGDRFFHLLVRHLATALNVQYAFVSEFSEDRQRFRTRAVWGRGHSLPGFEIPIAGTPCEAVLNGQMAHHPAQLQALFPADKGLVHGGPRAIAACRSWIPLGPASATSPSWMTNPWPTDLAASIMRIFAVRARAEIERLRVEQALRENEERYRDLYDEAPVAYLSLGTDARIRRANRQAAEMFGYPLDQLLGRVVFDLLADTPSGKPKARAIFDRFLAGLETLNEEIEWRRADGTTLWTRASVRPIFDAQGRVEATRSTHVDITDRKRMEEALRLSEERLRVFLISATDAIITFDKTRSSNSLTMPPRRYFAARQSRRSASRSIVFSPTDFGVRSTARYKRSHRRTRRHLTCGHPTGSLPDEPTGESFPSRRPSPVSRSAGNTLYPHPPRY